MTIVRQLLTISSAKRFGEMSCLNEVEKRESCSERVSTPYVLSKQQWKNIRCLPKVCELLNAFVLYAHHQKLNQAEGVWNLLLKLDVKILYVREECWAKLGAYYQNR